MKGNDKNIFKFSQWVWASKQIAPVNEYADFLQAFDYSGGQVMLYICAKSDYVAYINGNEVGFNQFRDFPELKVYDSYDISSYVTKGKNIFVARALSKNYESASHIKNGKGIIFCISEDKKDIANSCTSTLSRISPDYISGKFRNISSQLGMSFCYDFTRTDVLVHGNALKFEKSMISDNKTSFIKRPVKKMMIKYDVCANLVKPNIYDFCKECSGYLTFSIMAKKQCNLTISYGEHLTDGAVRKIIQDRNFSVDFILKPGNNQFVEHFLRFGLRYLQLETDGQIEVKKLAINQSYYPVTVQPKLSNGISQQIYDIGINTLINCMHEHYEDCPWREQAMYAMDTRNQMLCGYYAFKEYQFARAALKTMIHRLLAEGLPITSPSNTKLSIGSFSLVYFLALKEYVFYSGDKSIVAEIKEKTDVLIQIFINKLQDDLLPTLKVWNFFEWSEGLDNGSEIQAQAEDKNKFALPLSAFFVVALNSYSQLLKQCGYDTKNYTEIAQKVVSKMESAFYDSVTGLYATYLAGGIKYHFAQYSNVMALYCGCTMGKLGVLQAIVNPKKGIVPLSLSNYIYKYEVLLKEGGYNDYIIKDINEVWGAMISGGATSFWETQLGEQDFSGAGSLCHGWSAIPVFIAHTLK